MIISTNFKPDRVRSHRTVSPANLSPNTVCLLIDDWLSELDFSTFNAHPQMAFSIRANARGALERQENLVRIGVWGYAKIILKLSLVPVEHQVHARVNLFVLYLRKRWHSGAPFRRIISDEVIAFPGQFVQPHDVRCGICA